MKLKNVLASITIALLMLAFSTPAADKEEKDEDRIKTPAGSLPKSLMFQTTSLRTCSIKQPVWLFSHRF